MRTRTWRRGTALIIGSAIGIIGVAAGPATADGRHPDHQRQSAFVEDVLVSDQATPGVPITDANLINPWGIAFGPTTPLWVANNGTSTSTLYRTSPPPPAQLALVVHTQPAPTGIVFNSSTEFKLPDGRHPNFLFDSLSGQISAWPAPPETQTTTMVNIPGAVFTGLALAQTNHGALLFAANASSRLVDVFDGNWNLVDVLRDDHLPQGLTPYNVAVLGGRVYVSYAPPPGVTSSVEGVIDVFDLSGRLDRRLVTGGVLRGPWGMALAPHKWGSFGGALLVGNEDGGAIHAFNPRSGHLLGTLRDVHGKQIGADGLWGIAFGNGTIGTPNDLVIAIGTDGYQHGVVALVRPAPKQE
ncbi:MAG: hypothetical protein QOH52_434 [Pseudonocardiales bacterium]|jgi:uncharacterized protein (TIGR03118 family)|nr:hypothetical protein [Pseudonocardiales bacterium]